MLRINFSKDLVELETSDLQLKSMATVLTNQQREKVGYIVSMHVGFGVESLQTRITSWVEEALTKQQKAAIFSETMDKGAQMRELRLQGTAGYLMEQARWRLFRAILSI